MGAKAAGEDGADAVVWRKAPEASAACVIITDEVAVYMAAGCVYVVSNACAVAGSRKNLMVQAAKYLVAPLARDVQGSVWLAHICRIMPLTMQASARALLNHSRSCPNHAPLVYHYQQE